MNTPGSELKRLALILPENRLWGWHATLAKRLSDRFAVDVFVSHSPPYPRLLRLWLRVERALFRTHPLLAPLKPAAIGARPLDRKVSYEGYAVVVNLGRTQPEDTAALSLQFDDDIDELRMFGRLMARRNAHLSVWSNKTGRISSSYAAVEDSRSLLTALPHVYSRAIDLMERAASDRSGLTSRPPRENIPPAPRYSGIRLAAFAFGVSAGLLQRLLTKPFVRRDHWELAIRPKGSRARDDTEGYRVLPLNADSFFADPFLFSIHGRRMLFAEQLPYRNRIGKIVCAELNDAGELSPFKDVLAPPHHLSYPLVFEDNGSIYMLPESGAAHGLDLYVLDPDTGNWRFDTRLMDGVRISDATLFTHEGRYWILASVSSEHSSTWDELFAFHAPALHGPWSPHTANPLVSDLRSARPAGHVIRENGKLLRPAQDCDGGYGRALVWCEIDRLTPDEFEERIVSRSAPAAAHYRGIHTYNADDAFEVVDLKRTLWRMRAWPARSRRHALQNATQPGQWGAPLRQDD